MWVDPESVGVNLFTANKWRRIANSPRSSPRYAQAARAFSENLPMRRPRPLKHSIMNVAEQISGCISSIKDTSATHTSDPSIIASIKNSNSTPRPRQFKIFPHPHAAPVIENFPWSARTRRYRLTWKWCITDHAYITVSTSSTVHTTRSIVLVLNPDMITTILRISQNQKITIIRGIDTHRSSSWQQNNLFGAAQYRQGWSFWPICNLFHNLTG